MDHAEKMMSVEDVFEIVLALAQDNIISESEVMQDEEVLRPMRVQQQMACDVIEDYVVNVVSEGRDVESKTELIERAQKMAGEDYAFQDIFEFLIDQAYNTGYRAARL